jgi:hypothetical protein
MIDNVWWLGGLIYERGEERLEEKRLSDWFGDSGAI